MKSNITNCETVTAAVVASVFCAVASAGLLWRENS